MFYLQQIACSNRIIDLIVFFLAITNCLFSLFKFRANSVTIIHLDILYDSLDGGSAHRKASAYMQTNTYSPHFRRKSLRGVSALVRFGGKVYWWVY
jgi:hypothetical protein